MVPVIGNQCRVPHRWIWLSDAWAASQQVSEAIITSSILCWVTEFNMVMFWKCLFWLRNLQFIVCPVPVHIKHLPEMFHSQTWPRHCDGKSHRQRQTLCAMVFPSSSKGPSTPRWSQHFSGRWWFHDIIRVVGGFSLSLKKKSVEFSLLHLGNFAMIETTLIVSSQSGTFMEISSLEINRAWKNQVTSLVLTLEGMDFEPPKTEIWYMEIWLLKHPMAGSPSVSCIFTMPKPAGSRGCGTHELRQCGLWECWGQEKIRVFCRCFVDVSIWQCSEVSFKTTHKAGNSDSLTWLKGFRFLRSRLSRSFTCPKCYFLLLWLLNILVRVLKERTMNEHVFESSFL